jgi:hypothetical protein
MLNFDTSFLYERDIPVIQKDRLPANNGVQQQIDIGFYPEGGDLIENLNSNVAFKIVDQWGKPARIKAAVVNGAGKLVDSLRIQHDGMGILNITPKPGESYTAKWKDEKGTVRTIKLPEAKKTGAALKVIVAGDKRNFTVTGSPDIDTIHIVGTLNQFQAFSITRELKGSATGTIPTRDLPSGILIITVFDKKWNPLAERITFINNEEYRFNAEMEVSHWGLNRRARNEVTITVADTLPANFSVSVTDGTIDADTSNNIVSHLLLSSDIRGQIYNPAFYFSSATVDLAQKLDLVMLTNGWRRFKWNEIVAGKTPAIKYSRDTTYMTLSGKIYGVTPAELRDNAHLIIVVSQKDRGEANKILFIPVLPGGSFSDPSLILFDTANVYFQLSKSIKDATVKFMESRMPPLSNRRMALGLFNNQIGDTTGYARHFALSDETLRLIALYEGKLLENVTVKAKTKTPLEVIDEKYSSGLFSGGDGYQFDLINDNKLATASPSVFAFLQSRIPGLNINLTGSVPNLNWRSGAPLLFLDETPADPSFLASISMSDIAYIKVFRPPFYGAPGGSAGAIAVYTKRGSDAAPVAGKSLSSSTVSGYTGIRQFYSPNYATFNSANENKDLRTTLYWNPQLITTGSKNTIKFTFYNNDISKSFRVIIEGMAADGRLVHIEQMME